MSNLLIVGCSYSHLFHHKKYDKKENSYTIHLMKALGYDKLINLAMPGASPSTVNRILLQYLNNPVFGKPDFVFIQWPNANRNEYFIDEEYDCEDLMYITTSIKQGLVHFGWAEGKKLVHYDGTPWTIANNTWTSTHDGSDPGVTNVVGGRRADGGDERYRNAHDRIFAESSQQLVSLYKEVGIAENYLGNLKIPYAYVESDYWDGKGLLANTHHHLPAYKYAQHLCHKKFLIPGVGIQRNSPTYAGENDDYPDGHPGIVSHRNFADVLIPKLKEIINK
tara:strand:- start:763 stop:1599 length:837 start_codon:yes stop_codon:yes gene_type:complete